MELNMHCLNILVKTFFGRFCISVSDIVTFQNKVVKLLLLQLVYKMHIMIIFIWVSSATMVWLQELTQHKYVQLKA